MTSEDRINIIRSKIRVIRKESEEEQKKETLLTPAHFQKINELSERIPEVGSYFLHKSPSQKISWDERNGKAYINLSNISIDYKDLSGIDFSDTDLSNARFYHNNLYKADFSGAKFFQTDFNTNTLCYASFRETRITFTQFLRCNALGANFEKAELRASGLYSLNCSETNFSGTSLRECDISGTYMNYSLVDTNTIFPEYLLVSYLFSPPSLDSWIERCLNHTKIKEGFIPCAPYNYFNILHRPSSDLTEKFFVLKTQKGKSDEEVLMKFFRSLEKQYKIYQEVEQRAENLFFD